MEHRKKIPKVLVITSMIFPDFPIHSDLPTDITVSGC